MSEALERIGREVHIRFELNAAEFAERLLEIARAACADTGGSPHDHLARLSLDDLYLATACARGDERAWAELAQKHFDFMRKFATRFLAKAAAADLVDEVIADLWTRGKLGSYEGRSTLRTWLGTVVGHAALNLRARPNRLLPLDDATLPEDTEPMFAQAPPDAVDHEAAGVLRCLLDAAFEELLVEDKVLLQFYYEQGLTLDEIAPLLHISSAAVSRRLKRVREKVRAAVEARSRSDVGVSAEVLRAGLDLGRIELDLSTLFGAPPRTSSGVTNE